MNEQKKLTSYDTGTPLLGKVCVDSIWELEEQFMSTNGKYYADLYNMMTSQLPVKELSVLINSIKEKASIFYNVPHQLFNNGNYKVHNLEKVLIKTELRNYETGEAIWDMPIEIGKKLKLSLVSKKDGLEGLLTLISNPFLKEYYEELRISKIGESCTHVVPFKMSVKTIDNLSCGVLEQKTETTDLGETFKYLNDKLGTHV